MTIRTLTGLHEIAETFDGVILDLWGVVHDGVQAYPGAAEAMTSLHQAGKSILLLSNAPRRGFALKKQLAEMGIGEHLYQHVLSSGEAVRIEMQTRHDPFFASLGHKFYHLGPERDVNIFEGLDDYHRVNSDDAEFILNTGTFDFNDTLDDYVDLLAQAAARKLPMVCANPDLTVIRQGKEIICAGYLARHYQSLGGTVITRGKPDPAIYGQAMQIIGSPRVIVVGDSLHTDIAGANAAGLPSVWVTGGIHAEVLGPNPTTDALAALAARYDVVPTYTVPRLAW